MTDGHLPILYSFRRCPYAMRARMALQQSQTRCELREVVLRDKPAKLLEASPKGTVPVLVLSDGTVLDESLAIMRWSLAQHDPQNWLAPAQGSAQDVAHLIAQCDGEFKHHLDRYKYATRYTDAEPLVERAAAAQFVRQIDERLGGGQFLFGARASLADVAIAPFVRQFASADRDWFDEQPWPAVQRWLASWLATPLFVATMRKFPQWQPGAEQCVLEPAVHDQEV